MSEIFSIDYGVAETLCYPTLENGDSDEVAFAATPVQAGKVLRHLAATGEVDWSIIAQANAGDEE